MSKAHFQDKRFMIRGQWWLPGGDRKVAGDLVSKRGDVELRLYGGLNEAQADSPFSATPEELEFPVIHGESLRGMPITVLDAYYTKWTPDIRTLAIPPGTRTAILASRIHCRLTLTGIHLSSQDDGFLTCRIQIPDLEHLGEIKKTLRQEARDRPVEGDFYTGIRHAFAEIDGLGKLFCGEHGKGNTAQNAIAFATEYLGRVNCRYRELFGLLVDMYRHGLAHTHLTKCVRFRGDRNRWVTLGWTISDGDSDRNRHLTVQKVEAAFFRLWLQVPQFVDDTLRAIDLFGADLRAKGEKSRLFTRFKRGYVGTAGVFQEYSLPSSSTAVRRKRQGRPLTLNQYSSNSIAWIRGEIASGNAWSG